MSAVTPPLTRRRHHPGVRGGCEGLKSYLFDRKMGFMPEAPLLTSRRVVDLMRVASQRCRGLCAAA